MKLDNIPPIGSLEALPKLKPIQKEATTKNIPSQAELFLLCSNLLYVSNEILEGAITSNITADRFTNEALKVLDIIDNYESKFLTKSEFEQIKKDYKLKELYKN